jgi:hypothetical protein
MWARFLPLLLLATSVVSTAVPSGDHRRCRNIPRDVGWPSWRDWALLNTTVGGHLIATRPLAHVCHKSGPFAAYDRAACEKLGQAFQDTGPETLFVLPISLPLNGYRLTLLSSCPVPGEIFNPYWQNDSCSPFTSPSAPCKLGNRPVYSINVTGPADVQAGLKFAIKHNIRLVVRNTGIE